MARETTDAPSPPPRDAGRGDGPAVLVVDDGEGTAEACTSALGGETVRVLTAPDASTALEMMLADRPAAVLAGLRLAGLDGIEFVRRARKTAPDVPVVVVASCATVEPAVDAMKAGAFDFVVRPFEPRDLRSAVDRALERHRAVRTGMASAGAGPARSAVPDVTLLAHQLKSPIASLRQIVGVVLGGYAGEVGGGARGMIEEAARHADAMIRLLDDWLLLVRLDEGVAPGRSEIVDVAAVLDEAAAGIGRSPEGAGRTILRTGEEIRASVPGDRAALGVLFGHVLGAAARRAGTDGRITVELRLREHDAVVDVGPAGAEVPADGGRGVFEPSGRERGPEGRGDEGLGLPLARRIARAHGGDLRVAPAPGGGAVFRVTLPVVAAGSGGAG